MITDNNVIDQTEKRKKRKEPNWIAALVMAIMPYLFAFLLFFLILADLEANVILLLLIGLLQTAFIIYSFIESVKGLIKSKKKVLFIIPLILNLISSAFIYLTYYIGGV